LLWLSPIIAMSVARFIVLAEEREEKEVLGHPSAVRATTVPNGDLQQTRHTNEHALGSLRRKREKKVTYEVHNPRLERKQR
jgi:hypothetical protein